MSAEKIKRAIRELGRTNSLQVIVGEVIEVNENSRTIDVLPFDDSPEIYGVRINAFEDNQKGLTIIPKNGSMVLVLMLNKDSGILLNAEEIDKILLDFNDEVIINGGNNDGIVLVRELTQKLVNLESQHNKLLADFTAHIHGDPISGVTSAIVIPPVATSIIVTVQSDIENPKIKH